MWRASNKLKVKEAEVSNYHIEPYCLPSIGMDSSTLESKFNDELKLNIRYLKEKPEMQELLKFFVKKIMEVYKDTYIDVRDLYLHIRRIILDMVKGDEVNSFMLSRIIDSEKFRELVRVDGNNREKAIDELAWFFTKVYVINTSYYLKICVPLIP